MKLSVFADDIIEYLKKPGESMEKPLQTIRKFSSETLI